MVQSILARDRASLQALIAMIQYLIIIGNTVCMKYYGVSYYAIDFLSKHYSDSHS